MTAHVPKIGKTTLRRLGIIESFGGACEVCGAIGNDRLQVAHLVARSELPRGKPHPLRWSPMNLAVLCIPCHEAFDIAVGVSAWWHERRSSGKTKSRRARFKEFEEKFKVLLRMRRVGLAQLAAMRAK